MNYNKDYRDAEWLDRTKKTNKQFLWLSAITSFLTVVAIIFCSLVYIANKTYSSAKIEGASMYPTINSTIKSTGYNDLAYFKYDKNIEIGDIIIVDYESVDSDIDAIKRLVAKGGDTICYYNGHLLLNGSILDESYLDEDYEYLKNNPEVLEGTIYSSADDWKNSGYATSKSNFETFCRNVILGLSGVSSEFVQNYHTKYAGSIKYSSALSTYVLTVPEDFIFFLGDNRGNSRDSSSIGPIEEKYMKSKVTFVINGGATVFENFLQELKYLFS